MWCGVLAYFDVALLCEKRMDFYRYLAKPHFESEKEPLGSL